MSWSKTTAQAGQCRGVMLGGSLHSIGLGSIFPRRAKPGAPPDECYWLELLALRAKSLVAISLFRRWWALRSNRGGGSRGGRRKREEQTGKGVWGRPEAGFVSPGRCSGRGKGGGLQATEASKPHTNLSSCNQFSIKWSWVDLYTHKERSPTFADCICHIGLHWYIGNCFKFSLLILFFHYLLEL